MGRSVAPGYVISGGFLASCWGFYVRDERRPSTISEDLKILENPTQAQGDHTNPTQKHPELEPRTFLLQGFCTGNSTGGEEAKCGLKVSQPINLQ